MVIVNTNPLYAPRELRHQFSDADVEVLITLDANLLQVKAALKDRLTETSPTATVNPQDDIHIGTVGAPLPDTELKVIDADGNELPPGQPGELLIRGPQVMRGYWRRPEEIAQVLTADGWLRTGDIAVIQDDGFVRIVDRLKDMILVSGFNVYPVDCLPFCALESCCAAVVVNNLIHIVESLSIGKETAKTGNDPMPQFLHGRIRLSVQAGRSPERRAAQRFLLSRRSGEDQLFRRDRHLTEIRTWRMDAGPRPGQGTKSRMGE